MAQRKWTITQRKEQSEKIRQWQPWKSSTGPKTLDGRAKSSRNAFKGGFRATMKSLSNLLRKQRDVTNGL